ncbi:helix-turn-helix domain-containing protein [Thalassobacillus hwangdonensis]|uniref:Helix-turn-helix domain-containing protein n=1 Tax=Thalassobacillus hwangdonensis TaxID=546108 RepID=A0ABW3L278_9BACI
MPRKSKRSKQPSQVPPLDERHHLAIRMIFHGYTRQEIADTLEVSRMQVWRWEQRKDFDKEYDKYVKAYVRKHYGKKDSYLCNAAIAGDVQSLKFIMEACDLT